MSLKAYQLVYATLWEEDPLLIIATYSSLHHAILHRDSLLKENSIPKDWLLEVGADSSKGWEYRIHQVTL